MWCPLKARNTAFGRYGSVVALLAHRMFRTGRCWMVCSRDVTDSVLPEPSLVRASGDYSRALAVSHEGNIRLFTQKSTKLAYKLNH